MPLDQQNKCVDGQVSQLFDRCILQSRFPQWFGHFFALAKARGHLPPPSARLPPVQGHPCRRRSVQAHLCRAARRRQWDVHIGRQPATGGHRGRHWRDVALGEVPVFAHVCCGKCHVFCVDVAADHDTRFGVISGSVYCLLILKTILRWCRCGSQ